MIISSASPVHGLEFIFAPASHIYSSGSLDNSEGFDFEISHKNITADLSFEKAMLRFGGQEAQLIYLYGFSLGYKKSLKNVEGFFQIGVYDSLTKSRDSFEHGDAAQYAFIEALGLRGDDYSWDNHRYGLDSSIGCNLGGQYLYHFTKRFSAGIGLTYRWLRLTESVYGWNGAYNPYDPHWEIFRDRNFSGMRIKIIFRWGI